MPGCILAELRDVLPADHQGAFDVSLTIQLFATVTPVSIPAQALERSNVIAWSAPIACATALLIVGSIRCVRPSRSLVTPQLITASSEARRAALGRERPLRPRWPRL